MTGKELVLLLGGTGLAAGGGGIAAANVLAQPAEARDDSALIERLDEIAGQVEATRAALDESRTEQRRMQRRMQQIDIEVGQASRLAAQPAAARSVLSSAVPGVWSTSATERGDAAEEVARRLEGVSQRLGTLIEADGSKIATSLGTTLAGTEIEVEGLEQLTSHISSRLSGLTKGLELRLLPEEQRWKRAREELGLSQVQEDEIKAAITARNDALSTALDVRKDHEGEGVTMTVKTVDPASIRKAQEAYDKRVQNVLNDEQRKGWKDGGFDNAFGGASSTPHVFVTGATITTTTTTDDDEE